MKKNPLVQALLGLILAILLAMAPGLAQQTASPSAPTTEQAKEKEALDLGVEAYIYASPLAADLIRKS